jgi:hypothetical protein
MRGWARRERQCDPRARARSAILRVDVPKRFEIKVRLRRSAWNDNSELRRPNSHSARYKRAQYRRAAAVRGDLFVDVADHVNVQGLRQKLRCCPVKMPIDAVLIAGAGVHEIVGKSCHRGEFVTGLSDQRSNKRCCKSPRTIGSDLVEKYHSMVCSRPSSNAICGFQPVRSASLRLSAIR